MRVFRALILLTFCVAGLARTAGAQTRRDGEWTVNVYPVPVFIPVGIDIKVDVPPSDGSGGGVGEIVESRFDGAFFGGVNATNGIWRIEGAGLWFAVGGNRREQPLLDVDLTVIYGDARLERRFAPHWYVMGGVRRIALDYDIAFETRPTLSGKPGVWDPLIGVSWNRASETFEWHASVEGGGFGVGADVDLGAAARVDWKFSRHVGVTGGYNFIYLKLTHAVTDGNAVVRLTAHGPAVGLALYF